MAALTEWLQLMLAEIARKREDLEQARVEDTQRAAENTPSSAAISPDAPPAKEVRAAVGARR